MSSPEGDAYDASNSRRMDGQPPIPPEFQSGDSSRGSVYYHRGPRPGLYGSADRLQSLFDGYNGLTWVFLANILLSYGSQFLATVWMPDVVSDAGIVLALTFGPMAVVAAMVGLLALRPIRAIGAGRQWSEGGVLLATILLALNSALCCGIIGYVVLQQLAIVEIRKYGYKPGIFNMGRNKTASFVANYRARENSAVTGC